MTKLKLLGATAALFALTATPALSQQAIQEPGLYAFYHPDGDSMSTRAPTDAMASGLVSDRGSPQVMARSERATGVSSSFDLALLAAASNNSGPNVVRAIRQTLPIPTD